MKKIFDDSIFPTYYGLPGPNSMRKAIVVDRECDNQAVSVCGKGSRRVSSLIDIAYC